MSILYSGPRGDLSDIIAHGDRLNHAIFNLDELQDGIARLSAAGLIERRPNTFVATHAAIDLVQSQEFKRLGVFEQVGALAEKLYAMPAPARPPEPPSVPTEAEFAAAYTKYDAEFQRTYERLTRGE